MSRRSPASPSTKAAPDAVRVDVATLRAAWMDGQGLSGGGRRPAPWLHAIGGVDVYLSARARSRRFSRKSLEGAVHAGELRVVPAARGCIMLVPREDAGLALAHGAALQAKRTERELEKLGVGKAELRRLGEAISAVLADGPQDAAALRAALPASSVRSLGEAGKKLGQSSTLPIALRQLEASGRVSRAPASGRLDAERYQWRLTEGDPFEGVPGDAAERTAELARRYFAWSGPATLRDFAWWSGLTQREARAGMESLGLRALEVEGQPEPSWVLPGRLSSSVRPPSPPDVALLPFRDPFVDARESVRPLVDEAHADVEVGAWGAGSKPLSEVRSLHHRAIVLAGALGGLWEYDEEARAVRWATFAPVGRPLERRIQAECDAVATFLTKEFGHARIYPMEPTRSRAARLKAIAALRSR